MKVLFVSIGSYGLLMPALGAAAELQRRGHTPVFLTHRRGWDLVGQAGFRRTEQEVTGKFGLNIEGWWTPHQAVPQFHLVQAAVAEELPDVTVADHFAIGALMAARASGMPVAVLGPASWIHPVAEIPVDTPSAHIRAARFAMLVKGYNETARTVGLPPTASSMDNDSPFLGDRYLLRSVPSFEAYAAPLPPRVRFVGACLHDLAARDDEALAAWMESDPEQRPIAIVQIEKLFDFNDPIPALLALLEERGLRTAAALGPDAVRYEALTSPSLFLRSHLLQRQILGSARLMISTGHPTGVLGAICAGVPNLILDYGSGAPELLHCCATAGNGIGIPGNEADAASLAPLLDRIIHDDAMHASARRIQQAFAEVDSFAAIADALEGLLSSPRLAGSGPPPLSKAVKKTVSKP